VTAVLCGNRTQFDSAVKRAETLTPSDLQRLGASSVVEKKVTETDNSLLILIAAICGGLLCLSFIVIAVLLRRRKNNRRADKDDENEFDQPMLTTPELSFSSAPPQQSAFGASESLKADDISGPSPSSYNAVSTTSPPLPPAITPTSSPSCEENKSFAGKPLFDVQLGARGPAIDIAPAASTTYIADANYDDDSDPARVTQ